MPMIEMIYPKSQRVALFVDVQNMYYSAKNLYKSKLNFTNIMKTAVAGRQLVRAFAYVIKADVQDENKAAQRKADALHATATRRRSEVRRKLGISEQTSCTWRRKKARMKESKRSGFRVDFVA